ncbi:MAG: AraC family transcriptional regulator [Pseudomonadota bacterium]
MQIDLKTDVMDAFSTARLKDGLLHPAPSLTLVRHDRRTDWTETVYAPNLCVVLDGAKDTRVGDNTYRIAAGQALIVSHHLPVASQVAQAPYLAIVATLDIPTLHSFAKRIDAAHAGGAGAASFAVDTAAADLLQALHRYLETSKDQAAAELIGPAQLQELHYRLLTSAQGGMLRSLITHSSHASKIARAIDVINGNFATPLSMTNLAAQAGMSESAFYQHFKSVTRMTPLQYQKQMRMHEAQRILSSGAVTVTEVAYKVGYESLSQFSREYSRKFGVSPKAEKALPA